LAFLKHCSLFDFYQLRAHSLGDARKKWFKTQHPKPSEIAKSACFYAANMADQSGHQSNFKEFKILQKYITKFKICIKISSKKQN